MLAKLLGRETGGTYCNRSEFFRTLLWREYNRRFNGSSQVPASVYSEMRLGRPKQNP